MRTMFALLGMWRMQAAVRFIFWEMHYFQDFLMNRKSTWSNWKTACVQQCARDMRVSTGEQDRKALRANPTP